MPPFLLGITGECFMEFTLGMIEIYKSHMNPIFWALLKFTKWIYREGFSSTSLIPSQKWIINMFLPHLVNQGAFATSISGQTSIIPKPEMIRWFWGGQTSLTFHQNGWGDQPAEIGRYNLQPPNPYCWWFRNPVNSPVDMVNLPLFTTGFKNMSGGWEWDFLNHQQYHGNLSGPPPNATFSPQVD